MTFGEETLKPSNWQNTWKLGNLVVNDFRWNFEKFLVNHLGQPVRRYDESLDPSELVSILVEVTSSLLTTCLF